MRRVPIIAAAVLLAWLGLTPLFAQRYTYRQYDSVYGLTDMAVHCLLQDHAGFIWAGTDNGLFRYDGSQLRAFHADDGLPPSNRPRHRRVSPGSGLGGDQRWRRQVHRQSLPERGRG